MKMKLILFTFTLLVIDIIFAVFTAITESAAFLSLTITAGTFFYHFAMRLLVGFIVSKHKFDANSVWFTEKPFEKKLYKMLKVKKWKNKMPTFAPETFDLSKHSLEEVIETTCVSEVVHEVIIVLSFVPLLFIIYAGTPAVFIVTSLLAAALDGIFVIMQRYNRPRLVKISKRRKA